VKVYSLLVKTWIPSKKRQLKSGKIINVKGYYDNRSPKRGRNVDSGEWIAPERMSRNDWEIPISSAHEIVDKSLSVKEMRNQAAKYANSNLRGSFVNHESNWKINVGRSGIDKTLSHGIDSDHFNALSAIPELLRHGAICRAAKPEKDKHKKSVDTFWYLYAPIMFSKNIHIAKLVIRENKDGFFYYDLDLSKKVNGDLLSKAPRKMRVAAKDNLSPSIVMISDIQKYINSYGGVLKKSHSLLIIRN
jgi:hypothetical protein